MRPAVSGRAPADRAAARDTAADRPAGPGARPEVPALLPFRGVRYTAAADLAQVLCPSGDTLSAEQAAALAARPDGFVRLVRPELTGTGADPAALLADWLADGRLAADPEPALYVYEQRHGGRRHRALIGCLDLRHPAAEAVRPHEGVDPLRVRAQLDRRRAIGADLEPILLCHEGHSDAVAACLDQVTAAPPAVTAPGPGVRLWRVDDPAQAELLGRSVSGHRLVIADGHHRWAAAREHARSPLARPAECRVLVMVVDTARYPLDVAAIHRVLPDLPADRLAAEAARRYTVEPCPGTAVERLLEDGSAAAPALVLTGGGRSWAVYGCGGGGSRALAGLRLAEELCGRRTPRYVHGLGQARQLAAAGGTALLLRPPGLDLVHEHAARGLLMPRKATSLAPKPWGGLVLHRWQ